MPNSSIINIVDMRVIEYRMNSENIDTFLENNDTLRIEMEHNFNFSNNKSEIPENIIRLDLLIRVMHEDTEFITLKYAMVFDVKLNQNNVEEFLNKFSPNMISIAFPYVRSYISTTTALAGIQRIDLPSINAYDVINNSL